MGAGAYYISLSTDGWLRGDIHPPWAGPSWLFPLPEGGTGQCPREGECGRWGRVFSTQVRHGRESPGL